MLITLGKIFTDAETGELYQVREANSWSGDDKWYCYAVRPPRLLRVTQVSDSQRRLRYSHPDKMTCSGAYIESCETACEPPSLRGMR